MRLIVLMLALQLLASCTHGNKTGAHAPGPQGNSSDADFAIREATIRTMLVDNKLKHFFDSNDTVYVAFNKDADDPPEGFLTRLSDVKTHFEPISKCRDFRYAYTLRIDRLKWINPSSVKISARMLYANGGAGYETNAKWKDGKWFISFPELEITIN
jgi:hypothetical protein